MPRYWASYGRSGFLGAFAAEMTFARGDAVVIDSPRGREAATILETVDERITSRADLSGTILRRFEAADAVREADYLNEAAVAAAGLPVLVVDAEPLLDRTLILHVMPWNGVDLTDWAARLSVQLDREVRLLDLSQVKAEQPAQKGCGKPGCGSEEGGCGDCGTGGGCSAGSCSKGSVKSADELTDFFKSLRKQMEKRTSLV